MKASSRSERTCVTAARPLRPRASGNPLRPPEARESRVPGSRASSRAGLLSARVVSGPASCPTGGPLSEVMLRRSARPRPAPSPSSRSPRCTVPDDDDSASASDAGTAPAEQRHRRHRADHRRADHRRDRPRGRLADPRVRPAGPELLRLPVPLQRLHHRRPDHARPAAASPSPRRSIPTAPQGQPAQPDLVEPLGRLLGWPCGHGAHLPGATIAGLPGLRTLEDSLAFDCADRPPRRRHRRADRPLRRARHVARRRRPGGGGAPS